METLISYLRLLVTCCFLGQVNQPITVSLFVKQLMRQRLQGGLWLFERCSGNTKIAWFKMYTKYNLGCTYSLFLGDPEKRLNPENLFLNSRSRFFWPCFPSPMLSSVSSFFPLCQLVLSVITTAPAQMIAEVRVAFQKSLPSCLAPGEVWICCSTNLEVSLLRRRFSRDQ